jgi:UDPglucose--hexose-1-phosphate uridylyltransferase
LSDIRFDPVSNQWVVIARNRQGRPMEFLQLETQQQHLLCPFCIGNEEETPPARATYRSDGSQVENSDEAVDWVVRIVPNKYPMFESQSIVSESQKRNWKNPSPYRIADINGEQEVLVCSPRHITSISELQDDELLVTFAAMQDRLRVFEVNKSVLHAMAFFNCRSTAGASLSHIHMQLIGSPIVSDELKLRPERNQAQLEKTGRSLIETCAQWEVESRSRMIYQSEHFYVFCPFASRFPFQVWLVPKHSQHHFASCPAEMRDELARSCRWLVSSIERFAEQPGYNLLLHQAPIALRDGDHWYFELLPRLTRPAGYEWGTNIWVNPVSPETAARRLKLK